MVGKEATVTYATRKEAERTRLNLYSAVRKYRVDALLDPEFHDKLNSLEIVIDQQGDGSCVLKIRHISLNPSVRKAAEQLGLLETADEDELEAMAARLANIKPESPI